MQIFSERLKELRLERNLTQTDVSEALGLSKSCYAGYEQGYREPDLKTLIRLADYFEVTTDYLLGRTEL